MSDDHELVMPFVVCQSSGGPYDDRSFVAGYQLAALDSQINVANTIGASTIVARLYAALEPQLDLLAMRRGWLWWKDDTSNDEWLIVTMKRESP